MSSPRATTLVHVVRHGEVFNPEGLLYGRLPGYGLSDLGRAMALRLREYFAGRDISYVVASPLQRAVETATPTAESYRLPVAVDEDLTESENAFEGKRVSVGDGVLRYPRYWPLLRNPFRPSWGEPYSAIADRMRAALQRTRRHADGHEAVCVSHQLPVWVLRRSLAGNHLWHNPGSRECALGSVTTVTFHGSDVAGVDYAEPCAALLDNRPQARAARGA